MTGRGVVGLGEAMPVTGGLNADQLAKQQSSPGQAIGVVATPQQAQKHSVAI